MNITNLQGVVIEWTALSSNHAHTFFFIPQIRYAKAIWFCLYLPGYPHTSRKGTKIISIWSIDHMDLLLTWSSEYKLCE